MARMPYSVASSCSSSMLTLPIFTRSAYSSASSLRIGAIILHGPHHSAQKSTRTGVDDCNTSWAKFALFKVTVLGAGMCEILELDLENVLQPLYKLVATASEPRA